LKKKKYGGESVLSRMYLNLKSNSAFIWERGMKKEIPGDGDLNQKRKPQ